MASITEKTIKDCGGPGDPKGPFLAECIYEYICFLDCSADGSYSDGELSMGGNCGEAAGSVLTYATGGPGAGMHTHSFGGGQILGVPYSNAIFMGLMSDDWHAEFLDKHRNLLDGKWHNAQKHNLLPKKYRYKMAKAFMVTQTWITEEDVQAGWACKPIPEVTTIDKVTREDWIRMGFTCPPYYKLSPCTDCQGHTEDLSDHYFEMVDGNELTKFIIEMPINSQKCYDVEKLQGGGPRNRDNHSRCGTNWMSQQKLANEGTTFESQDDCSDCKANWMLAVAEDIWVDNNAGADPSLINAVTNMETEIYQAVTAGHLAFYYVNKTFLVTY